MNGVNFARRMLDKVLYDVDKIYIPQYLYSKLNDRSSLLPFLKGKKKKVYEIIRLSLPHSLNHWIS